MLETEEGRQIAQLDIFYICTLRITYNNAWIPGERKATRWSLKGRKASFPLFFSFAYCQFPFIIHFIFLFSKIWPSQEKSFIENTKFRQSEEKQCSIQRCLFVAINIVPVCIMYVHARTATRYLLVLSSSSSSSTLLKIQRTLLHWIKTSNFFCCLY